MKKLSKYVLVFFCIILCGCGSTDAVKVLNNMSDNRVTKVDITIDEGELRALNSLPEAHKTYTADVDVDGDVYKNAGIKMGDNSDSGRYAKKLNYTVDLSDFKGVAFDMRNCSKDPTYMREVISSRALREIGLKVPVSYYIRLSFNGKDNGLYVISESVDKAFIKDNFKNSQNGNLYRAVVECDLSVESDMDYNNYSLVFGGDEKSDRIKTLAEKISSVSADDADAIEDFIDVDSALKYFAFNYTFGNYDSYSGNGGGNYYIYEENGYYTIIPGSLEMSFGGYDKGLKSSIDLPVIGKGNYPLIKKLLAVDEYKNRYYEYVEWYRDWLEKNFDNTVAEIDKMISDDVKNDVNAFYPLDVYQKAIRFVDINSEAATGDGLDEPETVTEATTVRTTTQPVTVKRPKYRLGDRVTSGQAIGMRVVSEAEEEMTETTTALQTVTQAAAAADSANKKTTAESSTQQTTRQEVFEQTTVYENSFSVINFVREKTEIVDKALASVLDKYGENSTQTETTVKNQ